MTTRTDETLCWYCKEPIYLFDKAPVEFALENGSGWATDHCGDIKEDFICTNRESSGRWPDGKPHEPQV